MTWHYCRGCFAVGFLQAAAVSPAAGQGSGDEPCSCMGGGPLSGGSWAALSDDPCSCIPLLLLKLRDILQGRMLARAVCKGCTEADSAGLEMWSCSGHGCSRCSPPLPRGIMGFLHCWPVQGSLRLVMLQGSHG